MTRIAITGGHLMDPRHGIDEPLDLFVEDGRVRAVGKPPARFKADQRLAADNCLVIPGLVELGANLGSDSPEVLARETARAAAGGITTLCLPPDMEPCLDGAASVELMHARALRHGVVRIVTLGGLTRDLAGEHLSALGALAEAGCRGVSNGRRPIANTLVMRRAMEYAASHHLTLFVHARDAWLHAGGCAHEGETATRMGLPAIPAAAETIAVARELALAELTGARVHFCRLSAAGSVTMVREARARGMPVSADVTLAHLYFCDRDIGMFDDSFHTDPPLRDHSDRDALRAGVNDGTITAICSDHFPPPGEAANHPFPTAAAGRAGLTTLLPLTLKLAGDDAIGPLQALRLITDAPAALLGLDTGHLAAGAPADLCLVDRRQLAAMELDRLLHDPDCPAVTTHTLVNGRVVSEQNSA